MNSIGPNMVELNYNSIHISFKRAKRLNKHTMGNEQELQTSKTTNNQPALNQNE